MRYEFEKAENGFILSQDNKKWVFETWDGMVNHLQSLLLTP